MLGRADVVPDKSLLLLAHLIDHGVANGLYAAADLIGGEFVNRIDRDHAPPALVHLGVEAGGAGGAVDDRTRKITLGEREHSNVLIERAAPGDDGVELDLHSVCRSACRLSPAGF